MEKERKSSPMARNILENSKMAHPMDEEQEPFLTVESMLENGRKGNVYKQELSYLQPWTERFLSLGLPIPTNHKSWDCQTKLKQKGKVLKLRLR